MKSLLTLTATALIATTSLTLAVPNKDAIMTKEKAAWQAFKDKDEAGFKKIIDKDFRGVYAEGVSLMKTELEDMKKWDMKSFTISDFDSFSDEKDVVVVTYKVALEGTYDGKDVSGTYNAGTVWKMENGSWLVIFHTDVLAEPSAK